MSLGESPAILQTGTKCPFMSLWMTSGWASHWGSTRWTCQHDPAKHVNTSLAEHCKVLSDHCTFCTGLLSNPPRTVNPVSSVWFGISSFDSTSCCSWRSSPLTTEFLRPSVDVTKIHKPNLSKLFLQQSWCHNNVYFAFWVKIIHTPGRTFFFTLSSAFPITPFFFFFTLTGSSRLSHSNFLFLSCWRSWSPDLFFFLSVFFFVCSSGGSCLCSVKLFLCLSFAFCCNLRSNAWERDSFVSLLSSSSPRYLHKMFKKQLVF